MNTAIRITIPAGLRFADLKLARDSDGSVSLDWAAIERVCVASSLDVTTFRDTDEDHVAARLTAWYMTARQAGEPPDPVYEDLIAEVRAEDAHGGGLSHQPGRA